MKTKLSILALAVCGMLAFTSCDDDDNNYTPDQTITKAFDTKYPNAGRVEWETKNGYEVADFRFEGNETEAWFDNTGKWLMTKTEINYGQLPEPVRTSLEQSEYSGWKRSDIDKVERLVGSTTTTVYVIEVEQGNQEVDLYYTPDGVLIKTVNDDDNDGNNNFVPVETPQTITEFIYEKYPGATIKDIEREHNGFEVDIFHNNIFKDVYFNSNNEWVSSEWDILEANVPAIVMNALKGSEYSSYRIDDIDYIETPAGVFYKFDLEQGDNDIEMTISAEGVIGDIRRD